MTLETNSFEYPFKRIIGLAGFKMLHTRTYIPTPDPILEFFDFIDKIKLGLIMIQNFDIL